MFEGLQRSKARARLNRAFELSKSVDPLAFELKATLARHLSVVSAGILEECVRLHISEYARIKSPHFIAAFVTSRIGFTTNLTAEKLSRLFGEFDDRLAEEISIFLDDRRRAALNSLIALRHSVAHGKDNGASFLTVAAYKDVVLEILDKIDEIFERLAA